MSPTLPILLAITLQSTPPRPDPSTLEPSERATFFKVASEEFCSCTSALTLAGCLELESTCHSANHLGRLVMLTSRAGLGADEILAYLSEHVMGPFCATPKQISTRGAPSEGKAEAPITVIEFADFRCAHCREAAPLVHKSIEEHSATVRYVFMPFPLQNNPEGLLAAEAALSAHAQGKFWEMHDAMFANQHKGFELKTLISLAKKAGLDAQRLRKDLEAHTYEEIVLAIKKRGLDIGVDSTPSFFVNGRPYDMDPTLFTLADRLDMENDRNRGKCQ